MEFEIPGDSPAGGREDLASLKRQIEAERAEKVRVERQLLDAQALMFDAHAQQAEAKLSQLEREQAEALENYEHGKAAQLMRETMAKQQELDHYRNAKLRLEEQKNQPMSDEERIDAWIDSTVSTPRAREYMRDHRDDIFGRGDPEKNTSKLIAGHYDAIANGMQPDTDDYYKHIDQHMGFDGSGGSARTSSGGGRRVVRLSKDEKEMCDGCGLDYADYAKQRDEIAAGRSNVQFSRDLGGPYKINAGR